MGGGPTFKPDPMGSGESRIYWRVEGSLLDLGAVRPVAFFTWNAQRFTERWARRSGVGLIALIRPFLYATNRTFATRALHTLLRGVSQDRLDLLGEEFFNYYLKPRLHSRSVERVRSLVSNGAPVVVVSQGLDHIMRPLAEYLGVHQFVANRLEFRDGLATGRLVEPVIRPRGALAKLSGLRADGRVPTERLLKDLGLTQKPELLYAAAQPSKRTTPSNIRPIVLLDGEKKVEHLCVRQSLAGRNILLIGATGFIGKVWLAKILKDVPDVGRVYLLIRRQGATSGQRRFERIVEESPVFESFHEQFGGELSGYLGSRVEVVEGDVTQPGLGIDRAIRERLVQTLDLVVNSSGLTDFNPDLRDALDINVDGTIQLIEFLRECRQAGLLHLSTCYVVGCRDGRIAEEAQVNYTPAGVGPFDAEQERQSLRALVQGIEIRAESADVLEELTQQAQLKASEAQDTSEAGLGTRIRRYRSRWIRNQLVEAGIKRAREFGWPNTYTFTKSLAESLIGTLGADLPVAIVRPSIVETSTMEPFKGWNEGVNTSAPISYLLGTFFRQLPSNERKCLDIIPVDLVCRGMTLIAAAVIERRHQRVYQLATSAVNPCDMRRAVELTGLAHRKYYRALDGLEPRLRAQFESIPVSKERYRRLSIPTQKAVVQGLQRVATPVPPLCSALSRRERELEKMERLIELYEPFILDNEYVFEADHVELLSAALPPEERDVFGYDALSIDWWEYWINLHIPALRKWSYPLIEGRPLESRPRRAFRLPLHSGTGTAISGAT